VVILQIMVLFLWQGIKGKYALFLMNHFFDRFKGWD
jgi:hypothetical protein